MPIAPQLNGFKERKKLQFFIFIQMQCSCTRLHKHAKNIETIRQQLIINVGEIVLGQNDLEGNQTFAKKMT